MFELLFSFRGTIGRVSFFSAIVLTVAFSVLCFLLLKTTQEFIPVMVYKVLLVVVTVLIPYWTTLAAYIKRYRSIGVPAYVTLIIQLIFIGAIVLLFLSIMIEAIHGSVGALGSISIPIQEKLACLGLGFSIIYHVLIPLFWPQRYYNVI